MNTQKTSPATTHIVVTTLSDRVFKAVVDRMLNTHYGIAIIDTDLGNDGELARLRAALPSVRPMELVQEIADDAGIDRIDCGWAWNNRLSDADEAEAIEAVMATTRQPVMLLH